MAGPLKTYAFINAKLRTRISKILPEQFIRQLVRARSLAESVQMLGETDFAPVQKIYERTGDIKTAELELLRKELSIYLELENLVEEEIRGFVHALTERFEVENLKNALRLWFDRRVRGRNIDYARGYLLRRRIHHAIDLDGLIDADDPDCQTCLPYGASCTTGAECCSGRCHPRWFYCKSPGRIGRSAGFLAHKTPYLTAAFGQAPRC